MGFQLSSTATIDRCHFSQPHLAAKHTTPHSGLVAQNCEIPDKPRHGLKPRHNGFRLQDASQSIGDNACDFASPIVSITQGNGSRKAGKGQRVNVDLGLKLFGAQDAQRRCDCPTSSGSYQPENRLIAVKFHAAKRLQFQPCQMRSDLAPHQLAAIIMQKRKLAELCKIARCPCQKASGHGQNKRVAQQWRLVNAIGQVKRLGIDAYINTSASDFFDDQMAGRGLQRQITLRQHTGKSNGQLRRNIRIKIVDNSKAQASKAGHILQGHCRPTLAQLCQGILHVHQISPPCARKGKRPMPVIDQTLAKRHFQLFQLLRSCGSAETQVFGSVLQTAGTGDFFEHLEGAQGKCFAKNLRQDNHFWLEEVSGQYASNNRGILIMTDVFRKSFTQQEPISELAIARATEVMRSGRLHRYNVAAGEIGPVAEFERAFADWLDVPFALALSSGGQALQIALRAAGVTPGDRVLTNGFTLAPVPGAIAAVGARPLLVETNENLRPDLDDLETKAATSHARVLMLSNMRGHLPDMEAIADICVRHNMILMEDCAHTMGAKWKGKQSGTFGIAGCFSTQTYKHMNSGEGGILTSDDPAFMARATILSGSYMLYARHGAGPEEQFFKDARYDMPNCSARMDAVRAVLLLDQIGTLPDRIARWNLRYQAVESGLSHVKGISLPRRPNEESYVGSSIQFLVPQSWRADNCTRFTDAVAARGVDLKWFGAREPKAFTSRYDSWRYAAPDPLPATDAVLARLFDMRLPLTFEVSDCVQIASILADEFRRENQPSNLTGQE